MKMTSFGETGEKQHLFSSPTSLAPFLSTSSSAHDDNTKCYFDVREEDGLGALKRFVMLSRNACKMKSWPFSKESLTNSLNEIQSHVSLSFYDAAVF